MSQILSFNKDFYTTQTSRHHDTDTEDLAFFTSTSDMVRALKPALPVYTLSPQTIENKGAEFAQAFPGTTLFAVKTNPHPVVISNLYQGGVHAFDVASLEEIRLVRRFAPKAELYFMHPIKSPESIRTAYYEYGVRHFVLDHKDELAKILQCTHGAKDLNLFVRMALPKNANASIDLSIKFGASPDESGALLQACRNQCVKLGLAFHVGTQISDSASYANAVHIAKSVIEQSNVTVDMLDVGGGFPVAYASENVPSIQSCIDVIRTAIQCEGLQGIELLAEPGRALVAQGGSLVVRVEARRGDRLYINDGTYGGLFDAGQWLNIRFPVQAIRGGGEFCDSLQAYSLAGPTCDSLDMMEGPFMLPTDIREGDWIEIKNTGAYSQSIRTNFNGFGACDTVLLYLS